MERYYDLVERRANGEMTREEKMKEIEEQDALMAVRLLKSNLKGPVKRAKASPRKTKKERDPNKPRNPNNAFNQEKSLSGELQAVLGVEKCSRPQVVKQLWTYIKDNNLQNPQDKRQILCDDKLQALFKKSMLLLCH